MNEKEIVKEINNKEENSILFKVRNGKKKLREEKIKYNNLIIKKVILLDNIPLVMLSEEDSPMNSSVIKISIGRSKVCESIKKKININKSIKNLQEGFKNIKPMLELLDDGDYELIEEEMIPTDGEGNYFGNISNKNRYYNATADIFYRGKYIKGFSKFLIPSEDCRYLDKRRVEYYREKIRNGEELYGVALELRGFMALLIDGHHKATAAYLEGKNIKCLIIKNYGNKQKNYNYINDIDIPAEEKSIFKFNIGKPEYVFPDVKAIAVVDSSIDISKERIEKLFRFDSRYPINELEYILYYLSIYDKEKAKELCFNMLRKKELQMLWSICLEYLAQYKEREVQDLFKNILISINIKECINGEKDLKIIKEYLYENVN